MSSLLELRGSNGKINGNRMVNNLKVTKKNGRDNSEKGHFLMVEQLTSEERQESVPVVQSATGRGTEAESSISRENEKVTRTPDVECETDIPWLTTWNHLPYRLDLSLSPRRLSSIGSGVSPLAFIWNRPLFENNKLNLIGVYLSVGEILVVGNSIGSSYNKTVSAAKSRVSHAKSCYSKRSHNSVPFIPSQFYLRPCL